MVRNEWVGDIGDFSRSGLLRTLFGTPDNPVGDLKLGVVWCLNNADKSGTYIKTPEEYRYLDKTLYNSLGELCGDRRTIAEFQRSRILPTDIYFKKPISGLSKRERADWLNTALEKTNAANVIFIDPDTGIAPIGESKRDCRRRPTTNRNAEHIYMDELNSFWKAKKSLIVYQDLTQGIPKGETAKAKIQSVAMRLRDGLDPLPTGNPRVFRWHRGRGRAYIILARTDEHRTEINRALEGFRHSTWVQEGHFTEVSI